MLQRSNIHSTVELWYVNRLFVEAASCLVSASPKALLALANRRLLGTNPHKECTLVAKAKIRQQMFAMQQNKERSAVLHASKLSKTASSKVSFCVPRAKRTGGAPPDQTFGLLRTARALAISNGDATRSEAAPD